MNKLFGHLRTVLHHRHLVMAYCFKVGLYRQGLMHDMSKFSPTEFINGVKYFQGTRSPNNAEREDKGYSESWMHHKGRNRHHFEYWTDVSPKTRSYEYVNVPDKYIAEMIMDRIAACKTYQGKEYTDASPLNYLTMVKDTRYSHPETAGKILFLLSMLKDRGEKETFHYIKHTFLKK